MTTSGPGNRRRAERLKLHEPLRASLDSVPVTLLEIGLLGAQLEHTRRIDGGRKGRLTFVWEDEEISINATVVRSEVSVARTESSGEMTYLAGVEFESTPDSSSAQIKRMISFLVTRSIEHMKANARGNAKPVDDALALLSTPAPFLETTSEVRRIYLCCRLDASGNWHRAEVLKPKQPPDGFTVPAEYSEDDITLLRESYEQGDEEERRMIRVCAEMSLASAEEVPPPSFV